MSLPVSRLSLAVIAALSMPLPLLAQTPSTPTPQAASPQRQQVQAADAATQLDTIVVTGFRDANEAAIETKREAVGIVDSVSQDTMGMLPDQTVGQVAARIPGVSMVPAFGANNDRSYDSAESVAIRGIGSKDNLITMDGLPLASASPRDRGARVELLPPSGVKRVEAFKTIGAHLDQHALSGQLNLVTASAFDGRRETRAALNVSVGDNSTRGNLIDKQANPYRLDGMCSTRFGADGQFGLVLAGQWARFYSTNLSTKPGVRDDTYYFYDPVNVSSTVWDNIDFARQGAHPTSRRNQIFAFENDRERRAGTVKLEWRPDGDTYASLFYGHFRQHDDETRQEYLAIGDRARRPHDVTATTGQWQRGRVEYGYVWQPETRTTDVINGVFSQNIGEMGVFQASAGYSTAKTDLLTNMSKFRPRAFTADDTFAWDLSSGAPELTFANPDSVNDLSRYPIDYIRHRTTESEQTIKTLNVRYTFNMDAYAEGFGFDVGAATTRSTQTNDHEYIQGRVFNDPNGNRNDVNNWVTMDRFVFDKHLPTTDARAPFFLINDAPLRQLWADQGMIQTTDRSDLSLQDDYRLKETIDAVFISLGHRGERHNVVAGVRYEDVDVRVNGWARNNNLRVVNATADRYEPFDRSSRYSKLLPSLVASLDVTDAFKLRFGAGQTLGRPDYSDYARTESIMEPDELQRSITINRGNPDLRPRMANNYDVSAEYYFGSGKSMLSAALFHKDLKDWIYLRRERVQGFEYEGETYEARITQPMNAGTGRLEGLELSARYDFADAFDGFASGFIVDGNVSLIRGRLDVVSENDQWRTLDGLPNQPKTIANLGVSYENSVFGAKIAYSWVDSFLANLSVVDPLYDVFTEPRSRVDAQVRFNVARDWTLVGQVQNLTGSNTVSYRQFPAGKLMAEETERGRVYWLGLRWRPKF